MSASKNKQIAIRVIKEEFPGITEQGINSLLANIEIETRFTKFVEIPQDYDKVMANPDLVSMQKNLRTLQGGKAEYDKLTDREKLGVLYQGDKNAKYAGGIGGLQLTAANYQGLDKFPITIDKIAKAMGRDADELYEDAQTDPEAAIRLSLVHLREIKGVTTEDVNKSTGKSLRQNYINPYETQGTETPAQTARDTIFTKYDTPVDPSSVIATEGDEKPEISPLRQSVIDKFLKQRKDPNAERLMRARMGDEMVDKILKGGEREIEEYVRSLDEDDLVKASDMTAEEVANTIKAKGDLEPELKQEEEFVNEILNNPSLYSVDLVKQAKDASKAIINYRARGMSGFSIFSDAKDVEKGITEELRKADLKGLLRKKSEQEGRLRDKQTGIKFKQITDPETGNLVTVEDIDLIGELPDAALPEGAKDAKIEFTDDELLNIEEEEEEDEDVTIGLSKRKRKKALRKAGAAPESKLTQFLKNAKLDLGDVSQAMNAAGFALSAGAGIMSIAEAREKDSVSKSQVDPLFTEAVNKVRAASETGMPYEQRQAAMKDINNAYVGAMKNVMAISGGQRGLALANVGVVDANRLNSLVDLASKDSDMRQKNLELFAKTSAEYSNQKLTADMNFQKLKATLDDNRKNRLADIGSNLLEQAQQYGANYTATRMADKLMDKENDADRVQGAVDTFLQNNPAYLQSFYNELSGIDQDNNLDSND
jgi:hypothetical protein